MIDCPQVYWGQEPSFISEDDSDGDEDKNMRLWLPALFLLPLSISQNNKHLMSASQM